MKYDCCELAMLTRLGMVTDACCSALNSRSRRRDILRYNIFKSTTTLIPGVFNNMRCDDMLYNLVTLTLLPCSKS